MANLSGIDNLDVSGDVSPSATNTYDLGALASTFRDLHLGSTANIGGTIVMKAGVGNIRRNTSPGSDNGEINISGAGANADTTRGGYVAAFGNQHGTFPGAVNILSGNVTNAVIQLITTGLHNIDLYTNNFIKARLTSANDGTLLLAGSPFLGSMTTDGADSAVVTLSSASGSGASRGAYIQLYGNESGGVGPVVIAAGNVAGGIILFRTGNDVDRFSIRTDGTLQNHVSANESTGAGSALLGANSPAITLSAPYRWIKLLTSDGSTVYVPAWK